jgi:hypothetical protein
MFASYTFSAISSAELFPSRHRIRAPSATSDSVQPNIVAIATGKPLIGRDEERRDDM